MKIVRVIFCTLLMLSSCGNPEPMKTVYVTPEMIAWQGRIDTDGVAYARWLSSAECVGPSAHTNPLPTLIIVNTDTFFCGYWNSTGCTDITRNIIWITSKCKDTEIMNHEALHIQLQSLNEELINNYMTKCGYSSKIGEK